MLIKKAAAFVTAVVMMTMPGASVPVGADDADNPSQAAVPETQRLGADRGSFVLTPSVSSVQEGGTVTVTLSIGSNPGINGMIVDLVYDPDVFQISSYSYYPTFFYGSDYTVYKFNFDDMQPGRVPVMWADAAKTDSDGNATVTPSEEEYEGDDWGSRRHDGKGVWDDEEELDNEEERW